MSLLKQLFLAICLFLLVAFTGSFVVSLEESRDQMVSQLRSHAQDAATALGLSLTPHVDDPAMQELMVSSIFDSGYFSSIRILSVPDERVLIERQATDSSSDAVPAWFAELVDLQPQGGEATLMRGWEQAARVQVVSHPRFALERLWDSALGTLYWLLGCGLLSALIGGWLLRLQLRPLEDMVAQAEAISRRIFYNLPKVPHTPELRRVVLAMNQMVDKLRQLFAEEARRSEQLRQESWRDSLTGLANRRLFDMQLQALLTPGETSSEGMLLLLHVPDLARLNEQLGGAGTDALLCSVAQVLQEQATASGGSHWLIARSRGGDFAMLAPGLHEDAGCELAGRLSTALHGLPHGDGQPVALIGLTSWHPGEGPGKVLARADQALMEVKANPNGGWRLQKAALPASSHHDWHAWIDSALQQGRIALYFQPVRTLDDSNRLWHHKVLARLLDPHGQPLVAGSFLPWVQRFGWSARLDLAMLAQTLDYVRQHPRALAISLSGATLVQPDAMQAIQRLLLEHAAQARWLTLELDARHLPESPSLEELCRLLSRAGSQVAVQHFTGQFSALGNLSPLGLAWLKVDGSYVRHIEQSPDKQAMITAILRAVRHIDLPLLAEMVETESELTSLRDLGVQGAMGRLIGSPRSAQEMPD